MSVRTVAACSQLALLAVWSASALLSNLRKRGAAAIQLQPSVSMPPRLSQLRIHPLHCLLRGALPLKHLQGSCKIQKKIQKMNFQRLAGMGSATVAIVRG